MRRTLPLGWTLVEQRDDGFAARRDGLRIIASWGGCWDHVSVSCAHRCPTWAEMSMVKDDLFDPEETVMQLHPPRSVYVNNHPFCLHLWRPQEQPIPMPPLEYV